MHHPTGTPVKVFLHYGAMEEGHTLHALDVDVTKAKNGELPQQATTLDKWWMEWPSEDGGRMREDPAKEGNNVVQWWSSSEENNHCSINRTKPSWILFAVFDSPFFGIEDSPWRDAQHSLKDCTVTYYMVVALHSKRQSDGTYR